MENLDVKYLNRILIKCWSHSPFPDLSQTIKTRGETLKFKCVILMLVGNSLVFLGSNLITWIVLRSW